MMKQFILLLALILAATVQGFVSVQRSKAGVLPLKAEATPDVDPNEIVGRRITVTGDVQGGYYRSCVSNEVSRGVLPEFSSFLHLFPSHVVSVSSGFEIPKPCRYHDAP
jgi:hypothetical protein